MDEETKFSLISLVVLFYVIQIIVCMVLLIEGEGSVYSSRKKFLISLTPFLWVFPGLKLLFQRVREAWSNLA